MFTGIIESLGKVNRISRQGAAMKLEINSTLPTADIALGDSIAVNGVCQTVEEIQGDRLVFHVLSETMRKTNLGELRPGSEVNLESALRFGGKLGGHLLSGHVDCTAAVLEIGERKGDIAISIARPKIDFPLVPKGSVAVNGVSLTVAELSQEALLVCIIPHTWHCTNLRLLKSGSLVNLEADMIGKYVQSLSEPYLPKKSIGLDDLSRAGFI
ncbi:MAG: riboflavin synthase [Oligosphaeraceae bacterium]|nr:riboflavin synthase [Oligosphaeraceae bacterium]